MECRMVRAIELRQTVCVFLFVLIVPVKSLANWIEFEAEMCGAELKLDKNQESILLAQHVYGGVPWSKPALVRRAYVTAFDADRRLPKWSAWFATRDFLDPPDRKVDKWGKLHKDPDLKKPVLDKDYTNSGFSRGHIVPHYISGGDRDNDGMDAAFKNKSGMPVEDPDDACTVVEVNYTSNITPQYQQGFNGGGGSWYKLEKKIRKLIKADHSFHIIAGPVFVEQEQVKVIGLNSDIHVPHSYFKIVIYEDKPVAFLMAHDELDKALGCPLKSDPEMCIVSVDQVEKLTGFDFFGAMSDIEQHAIESEPNCAQWKKLMVAYSESSD